MRPKLFGIVAPPASVVPAGAGWWAGVWLACAAIVAVCHVPVLQGYFQADDFLWLHHSSWADVRPTLTGPWGAGIAYRPLVRISYALDSALHGQDAGWWHATNLMLHIANGAVLASIGLRLGAGRTGALAMAALFLTCPMDWEDVDWISGRTGLMALLFCLLAMRAWLRLALDDISAGLRLAEMVTLQTLALMSYEAAIAMPLVLACFCPLLHRRYAARATRLALGVGSSAAAAALFWLARAKILGTVSGSVDGGVAPHLLPVLAGHVPVIGRYLWQGLTPAGCLATGALLAVGIAGRRNRLAVCTLLVAALLLYLPFAPIDGFSNRFLYLATAPLAAALVAASCEIPWAPVRAALLTAVIFGFGFASYAEAVSARESGRIVKSIVRTVARLAATPGNLVFDAVPYYYNGRYLLMGSFEDAVRGLAPAPRILAQSATVLADPLMMRSVLTGPSRFFSYDAATRGFVEIPRADWERLHGLAVDPVAPPK